MPMSYPVNPERECKTDGFNNRTDICRKPVIASNTIIFLDPSPNGEDGWNGPSAGSDVPHPRAAWPRAM